MSETVQRLSKVTILLHWLVAWGMIGLIAIGIYMEEAEVYALYPWHKSFGVLVVLFAVGRVIWRIRKGWPSTLGEPKKWEHLAAKLVHWVLILATLMYPISGMMMSGAGGHGISLFGLELVAMNLDANGEVVAINGALAGLGHTLHGMLTWVVISAIAIHVIGALKHHFVVGDHTLKRMLPGNR